MLAPTVARARVTLSLYRSLLSVALLLLAPLPARAGLQAAVFEPDPRESGTAQLLATTWVQQTKDYTVRLRRLDEGERAAHLQRVTGGTIDPFATPPGGNPQFVTFLLELVNLAPDTLLFHPEGCRLVTNRKEIVMPVGLERLQASYGLLGQELPAAYLQARPAILEGSRLLGSGQASSGLLVFPAVAPRTKSFRFELQLSLPSGESVDLVAPYRRVSAP